MRLLQIPFGPASGWNSGFAGRDEKRCRRDLWLRTACDNFSLQRGKIGALL